MKNKRGFTLIEILIVLVVLVTVTAGATIGIKEIQKRSEERNLRELYTMIETAADTYLSINDEYREELLNDEITEKCLRIYTLQNEGLLKEELFNPVTKKRIPGNLCVISFINDEGLIENHFDLDEDLTTHKVTLKINGDGVADAKTKTVYTKAIFNITADEGKFILDGVCDGGATLKTDNFKVIIYGVKKDQTCIVNLKNEQNKVTVEVTNGISLPTESIVKYGEDAAFSLSPTNGYEFDSLDCKNGKIEGSNLIVSNVTEDTLCKVNYKIKEFNITIEAKNGKVNPVNINASYGSNPVINLEPTEGYKVEGATTTCEGAVIDLSNKTLTIQNVTKSQTCVITFNPIIYTVTLDNQGANTAGTTLVYYKYNTVKNISGTNYYYFSDKSLTSALSSITKPAKTGYAFGGYFTNTNGAGTQYINANGTFSNNLYKTINDKTLYAKWTLSQYKLTLTKGTGVSAIYYKINGASSYTKVTATRTLNVNYNSKYYYYAKALTGYSINSCTSSTPCEGTMGSSSVNKTLSATPNKYTLTLTKGAGISTIYYKVNGASTFTSTSATPKLQVTYGTRFEYYGVASTGYTYTGCTASSPCKGTMPASNMTFTLSGTINSYKVTLTVTNGVGTGSKNINYNSSGTFTGVKPNDGYTSAGASVTCIGGSATLSGTTVTITNVRNAMTCTIKFAEVRFLSKILSNNPSVSTRTDFSKYYINDNTGTLYKTTETITGISSAKDVYYFSGNAKNNWVKFGSYSTTKVVYRGYFETTSKTYYMDYDTKAKCETGIKGNGNDEYKYIFNKNCEAILLYQKGDPMYWRIIRTNHDSSIRLLYSGTSPSTTMGYIGATPFNAESSGYYTTVGYKYGAGGSIDTVRQNTTNSTIKIYIDNWYKNNLTSYTNYLSKDAVYCNSRTLTFTGSSGADFETITRLAADAPTLNCSNVKDAFSVNNSSAKLDYPVGLMTADEVTYAGSVYFDYRSTPLKGYYYTNSVGGAIVGNDNRWWTMSPTGYTNNNISGRKESCFGVFNMTKYVLNKVYSDTSAEIGQLLLGITTESKVVRPVISLKSCTLWKSGNGSANSPYEIIENGGC